MLDKSVLSYKIISLTELILELGEERVSDILSSFSCPKNTDIEYFLKNSAISLDKQGISKTHLVFSVSENKLILVGYFALTYKIFTISFKRISNTLKRKIMKFATYNEHLDEYQISAPLIAQLGKNFTNKYNTLISGDELLEMACNTIVEVQMRIGGKIVYLECADKKNLITFYEKNEFKQFGYRKLDKNNKNESEERYLLQYLKYL